MIRLFRVSIPTSLVVLIICESILFAACYFVAGIWGIDPSLGAWFYFRYDYGWFQVLLVVMSLQLGLYFMDLYDLRPYTRTYLVQQLCLLVGVAFLIQALGSYSKSPLLELPQWTMVAGSLLALIVIPVWRTAFFKLIRSAIPPQKVLLLGLSPIAEEITLLLNERSEFGITILGYLEDQRSTEVPPYLGPVKELVAVDNYYKPDRIVVSPNKDDSWLPTSTLIDLRMSGRQMEEVATLYEQLFGRVSIQALKPHHLIFSGYLGPRRWTTRLQTLYSFVLGLAGMIVALPLMVLTALLVKVTSPGPALYSQERVGLNGKTFRLYKFRSMYIDAEARTGPVWASKNDPRVTPLGRWLRKLRVDELPQLFNVLKGEMALVGPRPERPQFCKILEEKIPFYHQRHAVKPGITGWAQINHKYTETIEDTSTKLEYDLYYVKNLAPTLDAYIIFHTLKVMLLFRGAQ